MESPPHQMIEESILQSLGVARLAARVGCNPRHTECFKNTFFNHSVLKDCFFNYLVQHAAPND